MDRTICLTQSINEILSKFDSRTKKDEFSLIALEDPVQPAAEQSILLEATASYCHIERVFSLTSQLVILEAYRLDSEATIMNIMNFGKESMAGCKLVLDERTFEIGSLEGQSAKVISSSDKLNCPKSAILSFTNFQGTNMTVSLQASF